MSLNSVNNSSPLTSSAEVNEIESAFGFIYQISNVLDQSSITGNICSISKYEFKKWNNNSVEFKDTNQSINSYQFSINFLHGSIKATEESKVNKERLMRELIPSENNIERIKLAIPEIDKLAKRLVTYGKENYLVGYYYFGRFFCDQLSKMKLDNISAKRFFIYSEPGLTKNDKKSDKQSFLPIIGYAMSVLLNIEDEKYQVFLYDPTNTMAYIFLETDVIDQIKEVTLFSFLDKKKSKAFQFAKEGYLKNDLSYFVAIPGKNIDEIIPYLLQPDPKVISERALCVTFMDKNSSCNAAELKFAVITGLSLGHFLETLENCLKEERKCLLSLKEANNGQSILEFLVKIPWESFKAGLENYLDLIQKILESKTMTSEEITELLEICILNEAEKTIQLNCSFDSPVRLVENMTTSLFGSTFLYKNMGKNGRLFACKIIEMVDKELLSNEQAKSILHEGALVKYKGYEDQTISTCTQYAKDHGFSEAIGTAEMIKEKFPEWNYGTLSVNAM